jgi:hypothetical protein
MLLAVFMVFTIAGAAERSMVNLDNDMPLHFETSEPQLDFAGDHVNPDTADQGAA